MFSEHGVCTINGWIDKFERYKTVTKNKKVKNYSKRLISPFIDKLQSETLEIALEDNFFKKYESLDIEEYRSNKLEIVTQIVDKILKIYEEHKLTNNSKV